MRLAFVLSFLTGAYSVSVLGPEKVISNTKGNVMVQCKYDESYTDHVKYWCKVNRLISCYKLVSTSEDTHSRITIRDNKTEGAFYITMTDLTKDDEGQYKCGIDIALGFDEQALVHVQVNEAQVEPIPASTAEKENRISKQKQEGSTYPTNHLKSPSMLVPLAVSFGVLLLLCCVAALIVCKIKRNIRPAVADKGEKVL
ncbi:hypothetical protein COCON_G00149370 [Conger conger]|uniref:Immunoglobulin domain-containing protein n=1 Tax=Conger conger TaxID=82655 RepID=A0A9Q1DCB9_CONCO|nr:hypothetical protein COCON_G00149370 [Conger conger]